MELKCSLAQSIFAEIASEIVEKTLRHFEPIAQNNLGFRRSLPSRSPVAIPQIDARLLKQQDALAKNVDEEEPAKPELLVHILKTVVDQADGGPKLLCFRQVGEEPVSRLGPEFRNVGQILNVNI